MAAPPGAGKLQPMTFTRHQAALRITAVTAVVVTLGGMMGAATAALLFLPLRLAGVEPGPLHASLNYLGVAGLGGVAGALMGTPLAMLLLRRAPLWRATIETAGAAGIGSVAGLFIPSSFGWAMGAFVFAILAALRLRRKFAAKAEPSAAPVVRDR